MKSVIMLFLSNNQYRLQSSSSCCSILTDRFVFSSVRQQVGEKINLQKELEFYEWEGDLSQMQQNVRAKLNRVASVRSILLVPLGCC